MPKETFSQGPDANTIELRWGAPGTSGEVQLCTYNPRRRVTETASLLPDMKIGEATREEHPFTGWSVSLERQEINALIRTLRRARNAAYGEDA